MPLPMPDPASSSLRHCSLNLRREPALRSPLAFCMRALAGPLMGLVLLPLAARAQDRMPLPPVAAPVAVGVASPDARPISQGAEGLYQVAKPRLLQIRSLVKASSNQSSIGSGFLVLDGTLAVTNYHVVSQAALEPASYRLEYLSTSGEKGNLRLIAIDAAHDLAVVALDKRLDEGMRFAPRDLAKGEKAWSLGNPLDLGFTIVEGVHNGRVETSYGNRLHFVGAINAGMSGGPAVDARGQVIGVNVAKLLRGELTSFLVPRQYAEQLLASLGEGASGLGARPLPTLEPARVQAVIGAQLMSAQQALASDLARMPVKRSKLGAYVIAEPEAIWIRCWSRTNAEAKPVPRYRSESSQCNVDAGVFLARDLDAGGVEYSHQYLESRDLNDFQFASLLERNFRGESIGAAFGKHLTPGRCNTRYVKTTGGAGKDLVLLARTCARAYRDYPGLFDFGVSLVTQDHPRRALVSTLMVKAVAWDNGRALLDRFIRSVEAAP